MPMSWLAPVHTQMDEADLKAIVEAGERIIRKTGMTIDGTDEFNQYLSDFGCEIQGKHVHFPDAVIDKVMAEIADQRRPYEQHPTPKPAPSEVSWSTSGQALWCCDPATDEIRAATKQDLADFSRVVDSVQGLERTHPTFIPQDAPLRARELHALVTIILNSRKPHRVSAYSVEILPYFMEALAVAYGSTEEAKKHTLLPCKVWVNTPLMISREDIEAPMYMRKITGQPLVFNSMPVAGIAMPVTPAGALALMTAEVIGTNVLSLAVDQHLVGWTASPVGFDMRVGIHTQTGPEVVLMNAGVGQVAAYLFGGSPGLACPMSTAAKVPGAQSMMEKAFGMGMGFLAGARAFGGLSTLAFSDIGSVVQLMMEVEWVDSIRCMAQGFEVSAEQIAEEIIAEVAPRGAYFLQHEHTLKHYREACWIPELMDRRVPVAWKADPTTMLENARAKALHLVQTAPNQCPLSDAQRKDLQKILDAADRELGD